MESFRYDGVGDHIDTLPSLLQKLGPQSRVFSPRPYELDAKSKWCHFDSPCVGDTYHRICVLQRAQQELVRQYGCRIVKSEQAVIREDRTHSHMVSVKDGFVGHGREARVPMHQLDAFAEKDRPEVRQEGEEVGECRGGGDRRERDVIDLQTRHKVTDANSVWGMRVRDHNDL